MKEGFEEKFSDIQTDMVFVCAEYAEKKCDKIYVYASFEDRCISCDFFYQINNKLYERNNLPEGFDVGADRQMQVLENLTSDMEKLLSACSEYEAQMPAEIKIIYDVKQNKLNASYKYEAVYSNTDKSADDIVEEWFEEIRKTL